MGKGGDQGLQLLRSRSVWLLVSPGTDQTRSGKLRCGTTSAGEPTQETSKDRSDNLESYLRGKRDAMSIVAVPSPLQEQQRSVVRFREQLVRDRRRAEARGRALALTQGILAPVGWWRPAAWKQFETQLPEWMDSQVEHWQEEALAVDAKERQVRRELENMVSIELPIGVGALSWITLQLEMRGWDRFQNRRQIASYTGLCPGIHNSNGRGREGHINRCGTQWYLTPL